MGSIAESWPKMSGQFLLKHAQTKEELDAIMDVIWAANYDPYEPFIQIVFPVLGFQPSDRETSVAESKARFWKNHQNNSASNWYYVEDVKTSQVVGCAQWEVYLDNPFSKGPPKLEAPWWPKGEYREYCESILNQLYKPRASWMTRPHLALNWLAVMPIHRRRGIANLLVQTGLKRADSLNLECWLEASGMGKSLYERHDYRTLFKIDFDTNKKHASDTWRRCEYEMRPQPAFVMWRPKQGDWKEMNGEGGVRMPWQLGTQCDT